MYFKSAKKKFVPSLFSLLLALFLVFGSSSLHRVYASASPPIVGSIIGLLQNILNGDAAELFRMALCEPTRLIYRNIMMDQPQSSILRTHYFLTAAGPLNAIYTFFGVSLDSLPRCMPFIGSTIHWVCENPTILAIIAQPDDPPPFCGPVVELFRYEAGGSSGEPVGSINGGFLGIAGKIHSYTYYQAPPVNLAYFWNDAVGDIPVVGSALAADPDTHGDLADPFSEEILIAWKVIRNIAFGFLALYMFYVGILIMTRKHVDQRTVVTIQYALPKLVIAILLMAFSYAIGTLVTQVSWVVAHNMKDIIRGAFQASGATYYAWAFDITFIGLIALYLILAMLLAPTGVGLFIMVGIAVVLGLMYIIVEIKLLLTYFKLLLAVIVSPIELLLFSIPGSEKNVSHWFRKLLSYGAGMIALRGVFWITLYIGVAVFIGALNNFTDTGGLGDVVSSIGTLFVAILAFPLIAVFGLIQSYTAPKKVEALISGEKPGRK
ncbi:hypothetical protein JXA34_03595 [Patescibacteria group bacterium]|nr:hypothetical protein [Patescibacteria group bacterium]